MSLPGAPELSVVIPVYNEASGIAAVVAEWEAELDRLGLAAELQLYDDGSRDGSGETLAALAARSHRLVVRTHANRGHGPTILRGYREARGNWVAQADGDGEIPAAAFVALWEARQGADFVLGVRQSRPQSPSRRLLSRGARLAARALAGAPIADVNCPFRLVRAPALHELLAAIPEDAAVPNVLLAALAVRRGLRWREVPVPFVGRRSGVSSLAAGKLLRLALRAVREVAAVARGRRR